MANAAPSLTTPGKLTGPRLIKSTPMNRLGSASQAMSDGYRDLKVDSVAPYIANDIKSHQRVPVTVMLDVLLHRCLPKPKSKSKSKSATTSTKPRKPPGVLLQKCLEAVLPVCNDPEFQKLLNKCCAKVDKETDRYSPLIYLFNKAIKKLSDALKTEPLATQFEKLGLRPPSSLDILFHRSDPKEIIGSHGEFETERKPDIVVVSLEDARRSGFSDNQDGHWSDFAYTYALKDPNDESSRKFQGFQWHDLLSVVEVKLARKQLTRPPAKFTTTLHCNIPATENVYSIPTTVAETPEPEITTPTKGKGKGKAVAPLVLKPLPVKVYPTRARTAAQAQPQSEPLKSSKRSREQAGSTASSKKRKLAPNPDDDSLPQGQTDVDAKVPPPLIQSAMYGAEMLSRGIYATHALNTLIVDDVLWLWWYDRQGAIQSSGINFIQDWPYFMVLLVIFQRLDLKDWGIETTLTHADRRDTSPFEFKTPGECETFENKLPRKCDIMFRIGGLEPYFQRYSLAGRATRILAVESDSNHPITGDPLTETELALKSYWPEGSRHNEAHMIDYAAHHGDTDLIDGHLPDLICWFDIDYSTGTIRDQLFQHGNPQATEIPPTAYRKFRFILFIRLKPLESLEPMDFMKAWVECYRCHFRLWQNGIEHGDISVHNLMWNANTKCGVVNDFDLATRRDKPTANGDRTGTVPFMALDLLCEDYFDGRITRLYRHDLESFVWVFLWYCLKRSNFRQIDRWHTSNFELCCSAKLHFLARLHKEVIPGRGLKVLWGLGRRFIHWLHHRDGLSSPSLDPMPLAPPPASEEYMSWVEEPTPEVRGAEEVVVDTDDEVLRKFELLLLKTNPSFKVLSL